MSTLLFWQGRGNRANGGAATTGTNGNGPAGRAWLHAPDLLMKNHVAYLVKFLGSTTVDQPKGIEVVKEAIRRLQFTQQLRKSEPNSKPKKVEITISVDGVAIQEPRTNNILHQFPLHRISYCADDKGAKKFFSFIAKSNAPHVNGMNGESDTNHQNGTNDTHECFVFISNKLAAEITLTIGQAFDLAYRKFISERGNMGDVNKANALVTEYEGRLRDLASILGNVAPDQLSKWLTQRNLKNVTDWTPPFNGVDMNTPPNSPPQENSLIPLTPPLYTSNSHITDLMNDSIDLSSTNKNPSVGTKLEGLLLNSDSDSDFDPRAAESDPPAITMNSSRPRVTQQIPPQSQNGSTPPPLLAPPPKATKRQTSSNTTTNTATANNTNIIQNGGSDLFGSTPFATSNNVTNPSFFSIQNQNNINNPNNSYAPNYNLSDFNTHSSVFPPNISSNNGFTNGTAGLVGYDPFDTAKFKINDSFTTNGFSNPIGNGFTNSNSNGFGYTAFGDKQNNSAILDSSFSGFLDKRISEMKDGFSRGLVIGNEDFSVESLDPLRKN